MTLAAGMQASAFLPMATIPQEAEPPKLRKVEKISTDQFQDVVLESEIPVIVDFYADWCVPCKAVAPLLDEVAREQTNLRVVKVNIDHDKELKSRYRIESIPTVMVFHEGKLLARHTGLPNIRKALTSER